MQIEIIRPNESRALRFCLLAGQEKYKVEDCRMILPNENVLRDPIGDSSGPHLYLISGPIGNFSYNYAMLWENCTQDALDAAADLDLLEGLKIDDSSDEGTHLGNDGHLFDLTDVIVSRIPANDWQQDLDYILAIGRSMENPNLETWADI